MSKIVLSFNKCSLQNIIAQLNKIKDLEASSDNKYTKAKVAYKCKAKKYSFAIYILLADASLRCAKIFVVGATNLLHVEQIDPKIEFLNAVLAEIKCQDYIYPLIESHSEDKRKECKSIENTDQNEAISGHFTASLVELIHKFLLLIMHFLSHFVIFIKISYYYNLN